MTATLSKGVRVAGKLREQTTKDFVKRYEGGESIRSIAAQSGRSYGFVQGLLKEAGVAFRSRGGATRGKKATGADGRKHSAPGK